jgi:quinoprotein relay system zinc metallohydrolase 2
LCCLPALKAAAALLEHQPLAFTEIAPGLHVSHGVHAEATPENLGAIANIAFIVGRSSVAVIDTGGCFLWGQRLREAIGRVTDRPVRYLVNTHVHPDHLFGNAAFAGDAPEIIGHRKLPAALAQRGPFYEARLAEALGPLAAGSRLVPPTRLIEDRLELDLGDRILRLRAHRTAHTDNDLSVVDCGSGTLLAADLLFVDRIPALDGSLIGWLATIAELRGIDAPRAVPGHGPVAAAFPAALDGEERYLRGLRDEIRALLRRGGSIQEAVATVGQAERSRWRLFDEYHPRNVATAFAELEWE